MRSSHARESTTFETAPRQRALHLLVVVECPLADEELREKLRCPAHVPIRCEHAEDLDAAVAALGRHDFDLVIVATLGRPPRPIVEALRSRDGARVTLVVLGESEEDVLCALDAGATFAFERARLQAGVLEHVLGLEPVTGEVPLLP